jgi:carbon-monoxide dehydrogenase medium subunit
MYDFAYHKASSVADAVGKAKGKDDAKFMAGGQTLIPTLKQRLARPSDVIDLGGVADLKAISVGGGTVTLGAMATHAAVAASADIRKAIPALADLAEGIGDPQVRNRGTVGGSVANNDPAADYPAAVVALGATIHTDQRQISADDFFVSVFTTALEPGEIITRIAFPVPEKAAYVKFPSPASRYAMIGVFVAKTAKGPRVAVTGAGNGVIRIRSMEAALQKAWSASSLDGISVPAATCNGDIHGSAEYRAHLISVMAKRAVTAAG